MTFHSLLRFAAAGLTVLLATASTPTTPESKTILLDCQVIPIWCRPDDVCSLVRNTMQPSDDYHFILTRTQGTVRSNSSASFATIVTKTVIKKTSKTTITREATISKSRTNSSSWTAPGATTSRDNAATIIYSRKPTPAPSTKPEAVISKTKFWRTGSQITLTKTGENSIVMLDTPHDTPADRVAWTSLSGAPVMALDNSLTWTFPTSSYPSTRFVLWRDTLRLDVTTQPRRPIKSDDVRLLNRTTKQAIDDDGKPAYDSVSNQPLYDMTVLWRGTCSQQTTQLP